MSDEARSTSEAASAATAEAEQRTDPMPEPPALPVSLPGEEPGDWGELSDSFLRICIEPRRTIRRIVSTNPKYGVLLLAALGGSTTTLAPWGSRNATTPALIFTILFACTLGPLLNIAMLWIGAWIVRGLGHAMLGGQATRQEMRAALAWAYVPQAMALPIALLAAVLFAPALHLESGPALAGFVFLFGFLMTGIAVWSVVIASNTVAEVQGYRSAWKGLLNLLLLALIPLTIGLVAVVIPLAMRR